MTAPGPAEILIDSSLWIEYYRPGGRTDRREAVRQALARDGVATTPIVVTEILQGAASPEDFDALRDDFGALHWLELTREVAYAAARLGFELRRRGDAVPSTDLAIAAAALEHGCELWHLDAHYETIAKVAPLRQRRL